ncbi:MAG: sugar ABC transporter permease [Anaerolineae bacterium]|nr:sugar ABC transporter permease [Anaerolineae bacterium]
MKQNNQPQVIKQMYSNWFYMPGLIIFTVFFLAPTALAFYFSLTRWTLFDSTYIGLDNYKEFFDDPQLKSGLQNTIIYAVLTSGLKVIISLPLAMLLTFGVRLRTFFRSIIFLPVLISAVAVGITFATLMQPSTGLINEALEYWGLPQPNWLGDPDLAIYSVVIVDVWKGVGIATLIFIAGISSIPLDYFDAAKLEGETWVKFRHVILPLSRNATFTVILLSFIGGLRTFDLIWTMTRGGPGFASDVLTSVVYKQYQAGFYGLSSAGNVVLLVLIMILVYPMTRIFNRLELEL